jgi:hypothetical protein
MPRSLFALLALSCLGLGPVAAQTTAFPDTPHGKLAAGFFAAVNAPTVEALTKFQEANFSQAALNRYPKEERLNRNQQIREQVGTLTLVSVVSSEASELVLAATVSNVPGLTVRLVFHFTDGANPKIDGLEIHGEQQ